MELASNCAKMCCPDRGQRCTWVRYASIESFIIVVHIFKDIAPRTLPDQETTSDTLYQLYSVRTDGSTLSIKINGPLLPADSVYTPDVKNDYTITPDSKGVLYRAETTNFGLDTAMAGQFGADGDGQQGHQRIANAARFALIDEGGQGGSQGVEAEGKRDSSGQWHGTGSCGRVNWDTFLRMVRCDIEIIPKKGVPF